MREKYKWQCSATIIVTLDGKFIFQHRDEKKGILFPGYLSLLAGKVEKDETPEKAIVREIKEELVDMEHDLLFSNPILLFSFLTENSILEHIFLTAVFQEATKLHICEGQGLKAFNVLSFKKNELLAPHHKKAIDVLRNWIVYSIEMLKGGHKMGIKDFYKISTLGLKKDYTTMLMTGGFVDRITGPIASIIPKEPARYIALLEFIENVDRGNHYHKKKIECMVVLEGTLKCELRLVSNSEEKDVIILNKGQFITILPDCIHTYTAQSGNAITIEYSPQAYEEDDTIIL